jgi:hypothetical protein
LNELDDRAQPPALTPSEGPTSHGAGALLKYWLTADEYAALDQATRAHYFALGDAYRIKPEATNKHQEKIALVVLFALAMTFAGLGAYGFVIDSLQLQILGFCGAMPTFLGFLIHLSMAMSSSD